MTEPEITLAPRRLGEPTRNIPKYALDKNRPYVGDPWERQKPRESNLAYEAFMIFLELEPETRTIKEAGRIYCERHGLSNNNKYNWSTTHRWLERADAWDTYIANKKIASMKRQRIKSAERHAKQAQDALEVYTAPTTKLASRIREQLKDEGADFLDNLSDEDLMKLSRVFGAGDIATLAKMEREALGSVEGTSIEPAKLKEKGDLLRRLMQSSSTAVVAERMTLAISQETIEAEETG